MPSPSSERKPGAGWRARALWRALHDFFASPVNGILAGLVTVVVLGGAFVLAEELNIRGNSTEFCVSCHSMGAYVYEEYKQSKHYQTASGVRPECGDCHVSKRFWPAVWDHVTGTHDLISEFTHDWTKPEVFEEQRGRMAEKVRLRMVAEDSSTCRSCHAMEAIKPQRARGQRAHEAAVKEGKTCIACHYNLVHKEVPLSDPFTKAIQRGK
ncbi:MAG: NapC/NirT family cytochrome c [Magnetospirillum gryphiswaldense]|nr:NapC/NirT family cytochrome c [Magnetospirillum gryphiswaldense]